MIIKKYSFFIFVIIALGLFSFYTSAQNPDYFDEQIKASGAEELIDSLNKEQKNLLNKLGIDDFDYESFLSASPHKVFDLLFEVVSGNYQGALKVSFTVAAIIIVISIASQFISHDAKILKIVTAFGVLCVALNVILPLSSCITRVISAIRLSSDFMLVLIPVLVAVLSVSGNPVLALSYNSLCFAAAQVVTQIADKFIRPLIQIILSLSIITSVNESMHFEKLILFIKKFAMFLISAVATIFITLLSVKGMLANSADGVAVRGIRFLIGNIIPVIGGAVSDAYLSIIGTMSIVKNTVAVFAVAVIAVTNLPVLAECICWVLALNLLEVLADIFSLKGISVMLASCASAVSLLGVLLLLITLTFVLSIGLLMVIKGV